MSVDKLQEKIRKFKNPSVVEFNFLPEHIPAAILENSDHFCAACLEYGKMLLDGLKETVPAVRCSFDAYAIYGAEGLEALKALLSYAHSCGYYVLLDCPEVTSAQGTQRIADIFLSDDCAWYFDGMIVTSYIGSDGIRPYTEKLKEKGKALFVVARTANKSAPEMQDLLTGSRLSHVAKADIINRFAQGLIGRCGYSQVAIMAGASSSDSLRILRTTYKYLFLLMDGSDYPNANAKNCSFAFDSLGHGAAACAGASVTAAWQQDENDDPVAAAVSAAERMRKNLTRYVTIL